jgi:CheY-like chemotaxis protein
MNTEQNSRPKSVLLVDDDPEILEIFSLRCNSLGLETRTASNVKEALKAICQLKPDLLFVDVAMPFTSGITLLEVLSANPDTSDIPAIVFTGRDDLETINRAHELCAYYVQKSSSAWDTIQTYINELVDIPPASNSTVIHIPFIEPEREIEDD